MPDSDDLYARADTLARRLRDAGLPSAADRLSQLLHRVAWTTSSELIGELGKAFTAIRSAHHRDLPAEVLQALDSAIASARAVWPDLQQESAKPCPTCAEAQARIEIRHPSQLRSLLRSVRALVENGQFRAVTREGEQADRSRFELVSPEGPWPDVLSFRFQCMSCGMHFSLSAETYHGHGGEWRPLP